MIRFDYVRSDGVRVIAAGSEESGSPYSHTADAIPRGVAGGGHLLVYYERRTGSSHTIVPVAPEFLAFCAGHMPPYVFADWLEENVPDITVDALRLLRMPSAVEAST